MSRENTSPLPHGDGEGSCLTSSPVCGSVLERGVAPDPGPSVAAFFVPCRSACKPEWWRCANHGSIGDSRPMALVGLSEGHTVARETGCLTRPGYSPSNPCAPPPEEATPG